MEKIWLKSYQAGVPAEIDWTFQIDIKDAEDVVHTVVERTVYIAEKNFYRQKSGGGDNS